MIISDILMIFGGIMLLAVIAGVTFYVSFLNTSGKKADYHAEVLEKRRKGKGAPLKPHEATLQKRIQRLPISKKKKMEYQMAIEDFVEQRAIEKTKTIREDMQEEYKGIVETNKEQKEVIKEQEEQVKKLDEKCGEMEVEYESLSTEKKQTETVIRSLAEGVIVVNDKGETVLMNPAAERLLAADKKDMVGKSLVGHKKEGQVISFSGDQKEKMDDEIVIYAEDEKVEKILKSSSAVIENEAGQTVGMVSVLSDITKQKELDELKTRFIANVTHELRAPLVSVTKSLDFLMKGELGKINEEQKKFLNLALRNITQLSVQINTILDVATLESENFQLCLRTFKTGGLIDDVLASFELWARGSDKSLIKDVEDKALEIEADSSRLGQVLTNLVANALKFTPAQGKITVGVKKSKDKGNDAKGGEYVTFTVRDTGAGISEQEQKLIFDKFVQGSSVAVGGEKGTGLGLSIVKDIIALHGGSIWVTSELGKGSCFSFIIPMKANT